MKYLRFMLVLPLVSYNVPLLAGTAYKSGEYTSGMTKQCVYEYLGSTYTRTIPLTSLCPLSIQTPDGSGSTSGDSSGSFGNVTAFKVGEYSSGMTKQCIYEGLGSRYTRTIPLTSLCPLSISVSR